MDLIYFHWIYQKKSDIMRISVKFLRDNDTKELILTDESTVLTLFEQLKMDPDTAVIIRRNRPIPLDATLEDGDELSLLIVTSGG